MANNPFRQLWKDYLSFSKKDRNAIVILSGLILVVLIGHIVVEFVAVEPELDREKAQQAIKEWDRLKQEKADNYIYFEFNPNTISQEKLDSFFLPDFIKRNIISYRNAGGRYLQKSDVHKIYGMTDSIFDIVEKYINIPAELLSENHDLKRNNDVLSAKPNGYFDPNVAELDTLLKFGFNNYQATNLIKYRNSGGFFETPEDVLKIYGVDTPFFQNIQKHIRINPSIEKEIRKKVKHPDEISVELNSATEEQLKKLNGIGPVFASRIVKFRNLLGGFYSKKQLLEVYNLPEETYYNIEGNVFVDTTAIQKIRLNFADFGDLIRHPYLQEDDVKRILDFRKKNGPFKSVDFLYEAELIAPDNFKRVRPYLNCR